MYDPRQKVLWFSITSRLAVLFLQCIFNNLCPDHAADAFRTPRKSSEQFTIYDTAVDKILGGLTRWDAQYFLHIAKYGYTYENCLAFFPLYPMSIRALSTILQRVFFMLNQHSVLIIAAVLINLFCFVKSSIVFYDLSKRVLGKTKVAYIAAILYCVNPASIFFTAAYSESMFAYLTFYAMLASLEGHKFVYLPIGLSALVRSNGLINIGFPIFAWLQNWFLLILPTVLREYKDKSWKKALVVFLGHTVSSSFGLINTIFLSIVPFVFLQIYNYVAFCTEYSGEISVSQHLVLYAKENNLVMPGSGNNLKWCQEELPIAYSKIQAKYWNVGFMKYYEFKQIPNFLLAFPILYIMLRCVYEFFYERKEIIYQFVKRREEKGIKSSGSCRFPGQMFVFVVHGFFLTLVSIFFVHIQVSTRLLASASPLIYWYCASVVSYKSKNDYEKSENKFSRWRVFFMFQENYTVVDKFILMYFLGYLVAGCFMYSNFLPWT